jgi:hypothetical protein
MIFLKVTEIQSKLYLDFTYGFINIMYRLFLLNFFKTKKNFLGNIDVRCLK